jgi:hypothetical protein
MRIHIAALLALALGCAREPLDDTGGSSNGDSGTTGSATSSGDTETNDTETNDTETNDTGGTFTCIDVESEPSCSAASAIACECLGCDDRLTCVEQDCVCPNCWAEAICGASNCQDDGLCDPSSEGCFCADCQLHSTCEGG